MSLKWCDNADSTVTQLFDDKDLEMDYAVFTLEGKTNMVLQKPEHCGKGGRAKVEEILSAEDTNDKVMTGAFLASAVDERGGVTSTRRKYIHFLWVGPNVGVMVKGRVNSFSGEFRDKFPSCVIYLQLMGDLDQLEAKHLEKSLLACGGAHKPSRYSFTNRGLASAFAESPVGKAVAGAAEVVQQGVEKVQHVVSDLIHSSHHAKKETTIQEGSEGKEEEPTAEFAGESEAEPAKKEEASVPKPSEAEPAKEEETPAIAEPEPAKEEEPAPAEPEKEEDTTAAEALKEEETPADPAPGVEAVQEAEEEEEAPAAEEATKETDEKPAMEDAAPAVEEVKEEE